MSVASFEGCDSDWQICIPCRELIHIVTYVHDMYKFQATKNSQPPFSFRLQAAPSPLFTVNFSLFPSHFSFPIFLFQKPLAVEMERRVAHGMGVK